ncbi:hypothetical protein [Clostridium malenominatum]
MRIHKKFFLITAFILILTIVFHSPMPGVADQGDFQRVMSVTGIGEMANSSGYHWFKYVTPEYKIAPLSLLRLSGIIPTTSMIYPITLTRIISTIFAVEYFNTKILAFVYAAMYSFALYICLKYINIKRKSTYIFFAVLSLLILMDGNYLVWFNSLYGESMMITGLLLFISSILYLCANIKAITFKKLLLPFFSALLFLGAKMQCFSALPLIFFIIIRITLLRENKISIKKPIILLSLILIFYVGGIYYEVNSSCGIDTQYNSVFYGILKNSKTPVEDLRGLGLPDDMVFEAGKHAYLPKEDYKKYTPGSPFTINEFNEKISNLKLLKFYLLKPHRLIDGMEYTASQAFNTEGFLGKYEKSSISEYTYKLNRFTLWSNYRNSYLPKSLFFLIIFYLLIISVSILEYIRKKGDTSCRIRIELLWVIIFIGLLQFPMPYIGNGQADTGKQLFLFNYTFDITFLVACTWIFHKFSKFGIKNKV